MAKATVASKPVVLELGDGLKHAHDFYNSTFLARFDVIRNDTKSREEFIAALKSNKDVFLVSIFIFIHAR